MNECHRPHPKRRAVEGKADNDDGRAPEPRNPQCRVENLSRVIRSIIRTVPHGHGTDVLARVWGRMLERLARMPYDPRGKAVALVITVTKDWRRLLDFQLPSLIML